MTDLCKLLAQNAYPGRGIALGLSADGKRAVVVYFIMGRSENSRNRIFEETEDGIRTRAFDESKMTDPSLIIYHPVREFGRGLIVTNGTRPTPSGTFWPRGGPLSRPSAPGSSSPTVPTGPPAFPAFSAPTAATSCLF